MGEDGRDIEAEAGLGGEASQAQLSLLAAGSFVMALAALIGGCGSLALSVTVAPGAAAGVLAAPVIGLVAVVLGFLSLRQIERARGVVVGRPLGIAGLFLGILAAAVLGFMAMAALLTLSGSKALAPVAAELVVSIQEGRPARAREILSQLANDDLSAERLGAVGGAVRTNLGLVTGSDAGFDLIYESRRVVARSPGQASVSQSDMPRPVWLVFNDKRALAYVFVNQAAVQGKQIRIDDMLVFRDVNKVIALRAFGPGQALAAGMGWEVAGP